MSIVYYSKEVIDKAKQMDLLTYLKMYEPSELVRVSSEVYSTRTHDSLKISNGKWMWWSRGIGGKNAIDYLITVKGLTFIEAVSTIMKDKTVMNKIFIPIKKVDREQRVLKLPKKAPDNNEVIDYLIGRGINEDVISFFIDNGFIYQSLPMNNIAFVGFDENNKPRYVGMRGTSDTRYLGDAYGSDKTYPFRLINKTNSNLHIFEGAIDLLSYATLLYEQGSDFKSQSLVSLSGVYKPSKDTEDAKLPLSLTRVLAENKNFKTIYLHLDNDDAGRIAADRLTRLLSDKYTVKEHFVPVGKDVNDYLCYSKNLPYTSIKTKSYER